MDPAINFKDNSIIYQTYFKREVAKGELINSKLVKKKTVLHYSKNMDFKKHKVNWDFIKKELKKQNK